jgi:hypothetical protein
MDLYTQLALRDSEELRNLLAQKRVTCFICGSRMKFRPHHRQIDPICGKLLCKMVRHVRKDMDRASDTNTNHVVFHYAYGCDSDKHPDALVIYRVNWRDLSSFLHGAARPNVNWPGCSTSTLLRRYRCLRPKIGGCPYCFDSLRYTQLKGFPLELRGSEQYAEKDRAQFKRVRRKMLRYVKKGRWEGAGQFDLHTIRA